MLVLCARTCTRTHALFIYIIIINIFKNYANHYYIIIKSRIILISRFNISYKKARSQIKLYNYLNVSYPRHRRPIRFKYFFPIFKRNVLNKNKKNICILYLLFTRDKEKKFFFFL